MRYGSLCRSITLIAFAFSFFTWGHPLAYAATAKKVLFYGPTAGGLAASTPGIEPTVWDIETWSSKTTSDFSVFDAIVFGDQPRCIGNPSIWDTAIANREIWSRAITGNVIINGTDPDTHSKTLFVERSVQFAMDGNEFGPGLYVSLSCAYHNESTEAVPVELLASFGTFMVRSVGGSHCPVAAHKVATHAALSDIDDSYLSGWGCSTHEGFDSWPANFVPLAIITDAEVANYTSSDGTRGLVYILASGVRPEGLTLEPLKGSSSVGTTHTVTATWTDATKSPAEPFVGKLIRFRVLSGPNKETSGSCIPDTCKTDATGTVTWTYRGDGSEGDDSIYAFVDLDEDGIADPGEPQTTAVWSWSPSIVDSDEDGLIDRWETNGLVFDGGDGPKFIDLKKMGARLDQRDIFVQVDWMKGHKPPLEALRQVQDAFAKAPVPAGKKRVVLHLDAGPESIMIAESGQRWGELSEAGERSHVSVLGTTTASGNYNWLHFDSRYKTPYFMPTGRSPIFHYALFADRIGVSGSPSGVSRDIPGSDFIVSLGDPGWLELTLQDFHNDTIHAGTFMHELGHNLGLGHGGADGINGKPNYLSVMNYSFQATGLFRDGKSRNIDYSRTKLATLNETSLDEQVGLGSGSEGYGTNHFCLGGNLVSLFANFIPDGDASKDVNWNCSVNPLLSRGIDSSRVSADINGDGICVESGSDGELSTTPSGDDKKVTRYYNVITVRDIIVAGPDRTCDTKARSTDQQTAGVGWSQPRELTGYDDWDNLNFRGGWIGYGGSLNGGSPPVLPSETIVDELTPEQAKLNLPINSTASHVYMPMVLQSGVSSQTTTSRINTSPDSN